MSCNKYFHLKRHVFFVANNVHVLKQYSNIQYVNDKHRLCKINIAKSDCNNICLK